MSDARWIDTGSIFNEEFIVYYSRNNENVNEKGIWHKHLVNSVKFYTLNIENYDGNGWHEGSSRYLPRSSVRTHRTEHRS